MSQEAERSHTYHWPELASKPPRSKVKLDKSCVMPKSSSAVRTSLTLGNAPLIQSSLKGRITSAMSHLLALEDA